MSEAELQALHPPIRCGDGAVCARTNDGPAMLRARIYELGTDQSYGAKGAALYWCIPCGWRREDPLKVVVPYPSELPA
jgi:hypothetical protein